MKINIIMDNKNNWYYPRAGNLVKVIKKLGHTCKLYQNQKQLPTGSDITFYLGHEGYIKREYRAKSKYNIVVHASDLPKGKGMSPSTWQILENKSKIPITLFEVADGFDTGDYYIKDSFGLDGGELIDEWQKKLGDCIEKMILRFIKKHKSLKAKKQKGKSTIYKRRSAKDSEISINKTIKEQFGLLRVVDNERYPAFFTYKGAKYILKIYKDK